MDTMFSQWFDKVRSVPIVDVIAFLGIPFSHNGKSKVRSACILPNHNGPNKTGTAFSLDMATNVWYCHGCQVGGGNIELVKHIKGYDTISCADFIASHVGLESYEALRTGTAEEREAYKTRIAEQSLVAEILTLSAHHFHDCLTPELRRSLLIPQGSFEPKDTWHNIADTWGIDDDAIEENLIGFDDGSLLAVLRCRGYGNNEILKAGLFYRSNDSSIGDSVFKNRLTFPLLEHGRVTNFIARATSKTWPCCTDDPSQALMTSNSHYAKYKKLPRYDLQERPYISAYLEHRMFGSEEIQRKKSVVMVEGVTDVILMRIFFAAAKDAGISEAAEWGVGSFLSNQVSNVHIEELSQLAHDKVHLLLLCDSETSGRGRQGAMTTARKLLDHKTLALIGSLPLGDANKVDPALWAKQRIHEARSGWQEFLIILRSANNILEFMLSDAADKLQEQPGASLSYLSTLEEKAARDILACLALLPELQQETYLKPLAQPPFHFKLPQLRHMLKGKSAEAHNPDPPEPPQAADFPMPGIVPTGWQVLPSGVYRMGAPSGQFVKVAEAPIAITERYYDIDTGQYYLKAGFCQQDHWLYRSESREIFMSSRLLPGLAKWGFPTTTENARHLVAFLSEYEAANRDHIPVSQVVSSCGNKNINGHRAFVLGRRCIYKDREDTIEFLAPDTGDMQIVQAFEAIGDLQCWSEMFKKCIAYDGVMLAMYTSFSGPFLQTLKSKGFTCHLWGRSSIGKTITLILSASVWGDPMRLMQSWNQREVATERRMAMCNEVGIFLDELKQAISKEDVEKILYSVTNGHGRGRGSLKGQQKTLYWLLNLISTGEMPVTHASTDEGGQARVINIRDHLFGTGNREVVRELELIAKMNYGLAGPHFLQHADETRIQENYRRALGRISQSAKSDIAYRIGSNLAVLLAIGDEVNRVFGISDQDAWSITGNLILELLQDASTIDRATAALTQVMEWALANESLFYPKAEFHKDMAGVWKEDEYVAFFPYKLQEILERFGFNYDAVLRDWADRGWIKGDGQKKYWQIRLTGEKRCRMVVLPLEIIAKFL